MMRRVGLFLAAFIAVAVMSIGPATPAAAWEPWHPDCGTHEWHGEQEMTKGRTDGMVYSVDYSVGCHHLIMSNLSPAGRGEAQGNQGQRDRGIRYGQEDAARAFLYYFGIEVDPSTIPVKLTNYNGPD
jgi:hypothetical protein